MFLISSKQKKREEYNLWRAELAFKQTQEYLIDQESDLNKFKNAAITLLQWNIAITTALIGILVNQKLFYPLIIIIVFSVVTSVFCLVTSSTKQNWKSGKVRAEQLFNHPAPDKTRLLTALAKEADNAIENNRAILKTTIQHLKISWWLFIATPIVTATSVILAIKLL